MLGLPPSGVARAIHLVAPLIAGTLLAKVVKVLLWRPLLQSGIQPSALFRLVFASATLKFVIVLLIAEFVRRRWFRTWSFAWTPIIGAAGFVGAKAIWALRTGVFTVTDSLIITTATAELSFLYLLFRADLLLVSTAFVAAAVAIRWLPPQDRRPPAWSAWIFAPLLLFLGFDLAYFRKTGLGGQLEVLSLLLGGAPGTVGLAASELDWQSIALVLAPLAVGLAVRFILLRIDSKPRALAGAGTTGLVFPIGFAFLLVVPPPRLLPDYVRFGDNTLVSLTADFVLGSLRGGGWAHARQVAEKSPPIFDARLETESSQSSRRNVVLVMLESIKAAATSLYAPFPSTTPFLDQLAREGAVVDEMYAVAPRTSAGWVAILNGIYPGNSDMLFLWEANETKNPRSQSLPKVLRSYGYRSGFFLPTHLVLQNDEALVKNFGFDDVISLRLDPEGQPIADSVFRPPFDYVNYFGYEDRVLLEPTRAWVRQQVATARPFFLAIMTNVGHYPYKVPKGGPNTPFPGAPTAEYNDYLNSIGYIDEYLKDLVAIFRQEGLLDNTVFIIVGDHGESFGEHGPRQHMGQAYEEVLRVPGILAGPGIVPGSKILGLRQQIDILPTVFELLGITLTGGKLPGLSLLAPVDSARRIYFNGVYDATTIAARQGSTKFLYNFGRWPMEIYDLSSDPGERNDLAHKRRAGAVELDLQVWHESVRKALTAPPD